MIEQITNQLHSKKSGDRLKAAKTIGKERLTELGSELCEALIKESKDSRTWQVQCEMIRALGILGEKSCIPFIQEICDRNIEEDMITIVAAEEYIRLTRKDLTDVSQLLILLKTAHYSVLSGLLNALGYDKMLPDDNAVKEIIRIVEERLSNIQITRGFVDPRYGLAAAAAGWKLELVKEFLEKCLQVDDEPLKYVASNSLKSKYVKLR